MKNIVLNGDTELEIAPARLVFQNVKDPKIHINWGRTNFNLLMHAA